VGGGTARRYAEDARGRELPRRRAAREGSARGAEAARRDEAAREAQRRSEAYGRARGRL
jgi:hypothetical protein